MPIRSTRPRKDEGLKKYVPMVFQKRVWKFLRGGEAWEPIQDLIWGPSIPSPDKAMLARLKTLWGELREDILAAQAKYAPDKEPWGSRFDRK